MISEHFRLQTNILARRVIAFGLNPIVGLILSIILFVILTAFLFYKTKNAPYFYSIIAVAYLYSINSKSRIEFLKSVLSKLDFIVIRSLENLIISTPFMIGLIVHKNYLFAFVLLLLSMLLVFFKSVINTSYTIPTPFGKKPFEFTTGFRKIYLLFIAVYFLLLMSIKYDNFNLGLFALIISFLIALSFYSYTEPEYYLSLYSLNSKQFLIHKFSIAILQSTLLTLPIMTLLCFYFSNMIFIILIFQCIGYLYLILIIIAKYCCYPADIDLPVIIILTVSICIPPLMLLSIPYLYNRSIKKLQEQLV